MLELTDLRSYTSKTFKKNDTESVFKGHVGHIHYFNKLGVGDGEKRLREIDWRLYWNSARKGWYFNYHSFHPFLPEYADDWVEFRDIFDKKDQTTKYRAQCEHVKGRRVDNIPNVTNMEAIVYDDAFGEGIDYILYFTRSTLRKVVRIREEYKEVKDYAFEFEVEFPKDAKVFRKDHESEYEVDLSSNKEFKNKKKTLIGKEQYSYLKPFLIWDEHERDEMVQVAKVDYYVEDDRKYIRKKIPASYIEFSTGNVYTDTTTSYYTGAGDGFLRHRVLKTPKTASQASWDDTHDAAVATYVIDYTSTTIPVLDCTVYIDSTANWVRWDLNRTFLPVDTSGIPNGETITEALLKMKINTPGANDFDDGKDYMTVMSTTQASTSEVAGADYNNCGDATDDPTKGSDDIDNGDITDEQYETWTLNATGIGWIDDTGFTKIGMRGGHDQEDVKPTDPAKNAWFQNWVKVYGSEQGGTATTDDPYLEVTYGAAPAAPSIIGWKALLGVGQG